MRDREKEKEKEDKLKDRLEDKERRGPVQNPKSAVDDDDLDAALFATAAVAAAAPPVKPPAPAAKPASGDETTTQGEYDEEDDEDLWLDEDANELALEQWEKALERKKRSESSRPFSRYAVPPTVPGKIGVNPFDLAKRKGDHFDSYEEWCINRCRQIRAAARSLLEEGDMLESRRQFQGGLNMLRSVFTPGPECIELLSDLRMSLAYFAHGNEEWDKVVEETTKVIEKQPTNERALFLRAQAFDAKKDWEKRNEDLEQLLDINPEHEAKQIVLDAQKLAQEAGQGQGVDQEAGAGEAASTAARFDPPPRAADVAPVAQGYSFT